MKKLLLVLALFVSMAQAETKPENLTLSFDKVPVVQLLNWMYGDLLKVNYVMDSAVLKRTDVVTINYQTKLDPPKLREVLDQILDDVGLVAEKRHGYVYVRLKTGAETDSEVLIYRPKHRSVVYLSGIVNSLFKARWPTSQDVVAMPAWQQQETDRTKEKPVQQQTFQTGQSMFSAQPNRDLDVFTYTGSKRDLEKVQKVLSQIDTPAGEVLVKGAVYEVSDGDRSGSAVSLAVNLLGGKLGLKLGNGKAVSGDVVSFANANINAVFSVLDSDSRFKALSNPSLRVVSGQNARFSVGSDVPVLGAIQIDKSGNPIQSVEYRPSGVIFTLQPHVRDDRIELQIQQQLSSFIPTTTGVNGSPTLIKRELSTVVSSGLDDVVILGGLDESKETKDTSGPAFLPAFLRMKSSESSKTQILLVLQVQKL